MKKKFREVKLGKANRIKLEQVNDIIREYQQQNYTLTLRQLYYQLVSRDIIPNKTSEYSKLSTLLKEWRMWGIVDWDAIEDRVRKPYRKRFTEWIPEAIETITDQYMLDRMEWQEVYIEVWVEKDALSWVLKRITNQYWINIMVNRWYSSVSAMYDAFKRFKDAAINWQSIRVLYLWDFDPSWLDMIRDIKDRIEEFSDFSFDFEILPISLTRDQIYEYDPPPNPAKITDPRAKYFIAEHGASSREVDALKPQVLNKILEDNIKELIDYKKYQKVLEQEQEDIKELRKKFLLD